MLLKFLQGHLSKLPQNIFLVAAKMNMFYWMSSAKLTVDPVGIKAKFF